MDLKAKIGQQIVLTFLLPFLSLYNAIKSRNEKLITLTGTLFMGVIGSVYIYTPDVDATSHIDRIRSNYLNMDIFEFFQEAYAILSFQPTMESEDLYIHTLGFVSGSFFGVPELVHVFAGLVLGYFFTKSVLLVLRYQTIPKRPLLVLLLIVLFLMVRSISALNSIRMWTGMWVLFYGSYGWILFREKKFLLTILFAVFVHFSYLFIMLPVLSAFFLNRRKVVVTMIFLGSFFFSVDLISIKQFIPSLPLLEKKQQLYVNRDDDGVVLSTGNDQNFYKKYGPGIYMNYAVPGLAILLLLIYHRPNAGQRIVFLLASGMLLYALANVIGSVSTSFAGRTMQVSSIFITAGAIYTLLNKNWLYPVHGLKRNALQLGIWAFLIISVPFFLFHLSYSINMISIFSVIFPFGSWIMGDSDVSIRQAIGDIL